MNLTHHPELLDRVASSYALGTLRGGARRRFESMAREQSAVRAAALGWQSRLSGLTELQAALQPPERVWARVWQRLQSEVLASTTPLASATASLAGAADKAQGLHAWLRNLFLWRVSTAVGAFATVAAVAIGLAQHQQLSDEATRLRAQLEAAPQIEYVAVLSDGQSDASMLVTFDPKARKLTLQRVGTYQEAADRSLQLWALPPSGGPKSLGVLGHDKLLKLTATEGDMTQVPALAISLEPKGGVPSQTGPTGPVLFKGKLIQRAL